MAVDDNTADNTAGGDDVEAGYRAQIAAGDPHDAPAAAIDLGIYLIGKGRYDEAEAAYRSAIDSGHTDFSPMASRNLGLLLADLGRTDEAEAAYRQAMQSGHPTTRPKAANSLAVLYENSKRYDDAEAYYRVAIDSEVPDAAPLAACNLGVMLAGQARHSEAEAAYRIAIQSGHRDQAPTAATNLGLMLANLERYAEAEAAYQTAINSGHHDQAAMAARNLGLMLYDIGRFDQSVAAFRIAINSGHVNQAPMAAVNLGWRLEQRKHLDGAEAAYRSAIDSGHRDQAPMAARNLGLLLYDQGRFDEAEAAFRSAIDSGHTEQCPAAAVNLGWRLEQRERYDDAEAAYRIAIDSGHPNEGPLAARNLGLLYERLKRYDDAERYYRTTIGTGHADKAPMAAHDLGLMLQRLERYEEAEAAYRTVIESGHADEAPMAARDLGILLRDTGRREEAIGAFRSAIDSGHVNEAPMAMNNLGVMLAEQLHRYDEAEAVYRSAIESGHPDQAPMAARNLGLLLADHGRFNEAEAAFRIAIESGHSEEAPRSAIDLGWRLEPYDRLDEAETVYRVALDSGHETWSPLAARNLGNLLDRQGRRQEAEAVYRIATNSGHAEHAPPTAINLALLLEGNERYDDAEAVLRTAIDSGHAEFAPHAAFNLGKMLQKLGRIEEAKAAFQIAADSGHDKHAPPAAQHLIELSTETAQTAIVGGEDWSDLFSPLLNFCLSCGQPSQGHRCPDGVDLPELQNAQPSGILGRQVVAGRGFSRHSGIVLAASAEQLWLLRSGGSVDAVARRKEQITAHPPGVERVRSPGGELLAASLQEGLSDADRQLIRAQALADYQAPPAKRLLVADALALGMNDIVDQVALTDSERAWWRALAAWKTRDVEQTATHLIQISSGGYPAQLAIWWRMASLGLVRDIHRGHVIAVAEQLANLSPVAAVAAGLVLRALKADAYAASDGALTDATRQLVGQPPSYAWSTLGQWIEGEAGDVEASQLLGARRGGAARLGQDPGILDAAPRPILDDLIDAHAVPDQWIDAASGLECGDYLRARTRITNLPSSSLATVGAHTEVVRRSVVAGRGIPRGTPLPDNERERFAQLAKAIDGDEAALLALTSDSLIERLALQRALDDSKAIPDDSLLSDESLMATLARRSTIEPEDLAERTPDSLTALQRHFVGRVLLWRAKAALQTWRWDQTLGVARHCLRFAIQEEQRDEALNLMAAAHWQLGSDDAALKALDVAVEGEYTAALQSNIAVVAADLEPRIAAQHLSRMVVEAPNLALRVSAARQAVLIWGHNPEPWAEVERFPDELAQALRSIVVEPIDYDDFREIIWLLAEHDRDWLSQSGSLAASPHRDSWAARIWVAKASDLTQFVRELARGLRTDSAEWMERLRDSWVDAVIGALTAPDPMPEASGIGTVLLSEDLPMDVTKRVLIQAFTAVLASAGIDPTRSEPSPIYIEWLEAAKRDLLQVPEDVRPTVHSAVEEGFASMASVFIASRRHQVELAEQLLAEISAQVQGVPAHLVKVDVVRDAVQPALNLCAETVKLLRRLRGNIDPAATGAIDGLIDRSLRNQQALQQLLGRYQGSRW